jgi:tetratricopeptide (TPR) repeat protein
MKTITISLTITLLLAGALSAQQPSDIRADMLAILTGDTARFERGMQGLDAQIAKNPNDPKLKVLHGTGVFARSGQAFEKGDMQNAMKLWQSSLDEMAQAVELAPNDIFVRARRGVILISASRTSALPPAMAKPLIQSAVEDFEKVREIREKEQTLSQQSTHKRGELFTALADGWNRLGNPDKARGYFERVTRDLKGTIYEEKAKAWIEDKPEAKAVEYFACTGCHVE